MAVQIVVLLEVIDIGQQHCERRSHPQIAPPFDPQRLVETAAVGNLRQPIDLAQLREMLLRLLELQVRVDSRASDPQIDRLGDVVDGAELEPMRFAFFVADAGHEDDRNVARRILLLQHPADFVAVKTRHHHIEEDQIGRFFVARYGQRSFAVGRDADAKIVAKAVDEQLRVYGFVVRDQQQRRSRLQRRHDEFASVPFAGRAAGGAITACLPMLSTTSASMAANAVVSTDRPWRMSASSESAAAASACAPMMRAALFIRCNAAAAVAGCSCCNSVSTSAAQLWCSIAKVRNKSISKPALPPNRSQAAARSNPGIENGNAGESAAADAGADEEVCDARPATNGLTGSLRSA